VRVCVCQCACVRVCVTCSPAPLESLQGGHDYMVAKLVTVRLSLHQATKIRLAVKSVRDMGGSLGLCMNSSLAVDSNSLLHGSPVVGLDAAVPHTEWKFESGLDSHETRVLVEHEIHVNATRLIREFTCDTDDANETALLGQV
jgi:hypothetical protein